MGKGVGLHLVQGRQKVVNTLAVVVVVVADVYAVIGATIWP